MDAGAIARLITATVPPPGWWVVVATGVVALLVTASALVPLITRSRRALFRFNVLGTIVHEAGHAAMSCLTGGGVYLIEIYNPSSGRAHTWSSSQLSAITTRAAGYAAPPLAGLGAAALLNRGHAPAVLALTATVMVLVLLVSRDLITLISVLAVGLLAFAALYWGTAWVQHWVAYTEAWLLLISEIPGLFAIVMNRVCGDGDGDDADGLALETRIPGMVWIAGWFALIVWALWSGVPLLWP